MTKREIHDSLNAGQATAGKQRLASNGWQATAGKQRLASNGWQATAGKQRLASNGWQATAGVKYLICSNILTRYIPNAECYELLGAKY